jgi:hypothetical protein
MFYIPICPSLEIGRESELNENLIGPRAYYQKQALPLQNMPIVRGPEQMGRGKVKYRKIIPYNISDYLTPLALAI